MSGHRLEQGENDIITLINKILKIKPKQTMKSKLLIVALLLFVNHFKVCEAQTAKDYYNNGLKKYDNEKYSDAISDFKKALELNAKSNDSYKTVLIGSNNTIGLCYYELHNYETALTYINKAIELDSKYANFYFNRALVQGELQNNSDALQDYSKAIELKPDYAEAYANRGVSNLNLGNQEDACKDFKKALELGDNDVKSYYLKFCK
jgi:tetratricopeptide (TPR) repeat protein